MRNTGKKIISLIAAGAFIGAAFSFAACSDKTYKGDDLTGYVSDAKVESNGGFAVRKGDYVYFINGAADYTANNTYGEVVKGALMRISVADLAAEKYSEAKVVVPSLYAAQNFKAGIYIYGDYVYYATPTSDKNLKGEVENSWIDFKRAKLDGTEAPMEDNYFRLSSNTSAYRFVTAGENNHVYCLYEEDGALKSYNTNTGVNTVLVSGAKSSFFYDETNPENPNVYYTMAVTYNIDSDEALAASYDQVYCVNAAATATVNEDAASYTVKGGKTYDFDKEWMEEKNKEAKENKEDEPYKFSDYSTYPYVNLGKLVLDGVGSKSGDSMFNGKNEDKKDAMELQGYTYTLSHYRTVGEQESGVYFTRANVASNTDTKLYYLTDNRNAEWNAVKANNFAENADVDVIANDTTNASATALYQVNKTDAGRVHTYLYLSNSNLYRAQADGKGGAKTLDIKRGVTATTLWKTQGDYLYYYGTGTNGNNLCRINYTGNPEYKTNDPTVDVYNPLYNSNETYADYREITISAIDWNSAWYEPELFLLSEDVSSMLYSNAQAYGGASAYNYVYATKLGTTADIKARNEKYEAYEDYLEEYSDNADSQNLIKYYFTEANPSVSAEVQELYDEEFFKEVSEKKFGKEGEISKASAFGGLIGKMSDEDKDAIAQEWEDLLLSEEEEVEEKSGWPTWATWTIVISSVVVLAVAIAVPVIIFENKKKAKKREEEATVNAYKRTKIVTADDKSIDVYADEETEAKAEETAEEKTEE